MLFRKTGTSICYAGPGVAFKPPSSISIPPSMRASRQFKKEGFLPDAMNNYLALLGWNDGSEQEVFSVSFRCRCRRCCTSAQLLHTRLPFKTCWADCSSSLFYPTVLPLPPPPLSLSTYPHTARGAHRPLLPQPRRQVALRLRHGQAPLGQRAGKEGWLRRPGGGRAAGSRTPRLTNQQTNHPPSLSFSPHNHTRSPTHPQLKPKQHLRGLPDDKLVPLVAARLAEDGLAKPGGAADAFVAYATQVAKGSMELVNDASKIVGDVLTYPVRPSSLSLPLSLSCVLVCVRLTRSLLTTTPHSSQFDETVASEEAAALVEEGLWDMAREVVRAYDAGEMPKGSEGAMAVAVAID